MSLVAACPLLARLTALRFEDADITPQAQLTAEDLRVLGASPHLGNLRALELPTLALTADHARALGEWPALPRLRRLEAYVDNSDAFVARLARPGRLASLEHLSYRGPFPPELAEALAEAAPALARLEIVPGITNVRCLAALAKRLPLKRLRLAGAGGSADHLAEPPLAEGLVALELYRRRLSPEALASLTAGKRLAGLRRLSWTRERLGAAEARALAAAPFGALRHLDLHSTLLDAGAVAVLAASPSLAGLRWLNLSNNKFGDGGAEALASSPHLRGLAWLDLSECGIGPAGAAALAASPNVAGLRYLRLRYDPLEDEGVRALAASPHLGGLHVLDVGGTGAGAEGIRALARSPGLSGLRRLRVTSGGAFPSPEDLAKEFADPSRLPRLLELYGDCEPRHTSMSALGRPVVL
jgi:hypothetical protein